MNRYTDKLLAALSTGGAYSLEELTRRCTGGDGNSLEVSRGLDDLISEGRVERVEGAFRLVRAKAEEQKGLW